MKHLCLVFLLILTIITSGIDIYVDSALRCFSCIFSFPYMQLTLSSFTWKIPRLELLISSQNNLTFLLLPISIFPEIGAGSGNFSLIALGTI